MEWAVLPNRSLQSLVVKTHHCCWRNRLTCCCIPDVDDWGSGVAPGADSDVTAALISAAEMLFPGGTFNFFLWLLRALVTFSLLRTVQGSSPRHEKKWMNPNYEKATF